MCVCTFTYVQVHVLHIHTWQYVQCLPQLARDSISN